MGMQRATQKSSGFTLIELSIVLVIIGLLVGGVLVGRDLISAARLRKVGTELQQISTAIAAFRSKYDCLPGDCSNATNYFGTDSTCPAGENWSGTCNGNGNGAINSGWGTPETKESLFVWQQLNLALLLSGKWPGGQGDPATGLILIPGTNIPISSYAPSFAYHAVNFPAPGAFGLPASVTSQNLIQFGAMVAPPSTWKDNLWGAGLNAVDASNLDLKLDDGNPLGGIIYSTDALYPSIYTSNTSCKSGSVYLSTIQSGCTIYYLLKM